MPITVESAEKYEIVHIDADLDAVLAPEARRIFSEILNAGPRDIMVDFSKVDFIDSTGLGALVFLYKRLQCDGLELVFTGLRNQPEELLRTLNIDKIIKVRKIEG
jgi:anti-sigma B factor antagonist